MTAKKIIALLVLVGCVAAAFFADDLPVWARAAVTAAAVVLMVLAHKNAKVLANRRNE